MKSSFTEKIGNHLIDYDSDGDFFFKKKSQFSINKSSSTPSFDLEKVNKLFGLILRDISERKENCLKKIYKYSIKLKNTEMNRSFSGDSSKEKSHTQIKIDIIYFNNYYWLLRVTNAKFYCDGMYLSSLLNNNNSILETLDISFDITNKCSIVKLTQPVSNNLETEYLIVTTNFMIYPVHINDFSKNRFFLKKTFSEYLLFCQDAICVCHYILTKLEEESIHEILYCHDSFPNSIKCKIKSLYIILESHIIDFKKLVKEYKDSTSDDIQDDENFKKKKNIIYDKFKISLSIFYQNNDNWKAFAYAFMKDIYIYI